MCKHYIYFLFFIIMSDNKEISKVLNQDVNTFVNENVSNITSPMVNAAVGAMTNSDETTIEPKIKGGDDTTNTDVATTGDATSDGPPTGDKKKSMFSNPFAGLGGTPSGGENNKSTPQYIKSSVKKITDELCQQLQQSSEKIGQNIETHLLNSINWEEYGKHLASLSIKQINSRFENLQLVLTNVNGDAPAPSNSTINKSPEEENYSTLQIENNDGNNQKVLTENKTDSVSEKVQLNEDNTSPTNTATENIPTEEGSNEETNITDNKPAQEGSTEEGSNEETNITDNKPAQEGSTEEESSEETTITTAKNIPTEGTNKETNINNQQVEGPNEGTTNTTLTEGGKKSAKRGKLNNTKRIKFMRNNNTRRNFA
jgi:hypothetical protein